MTGDALFTSQTRKAKESPALLLPLHLSCSLSLSVCLPVSLSVSVHLSLSNGHAPIGVCKKIDLPGCGLTSK